MLIRDSTVVRVHPFAAEAIKSGTAAKVHGAFGGLGQPVELLLTAAQDSDIAQAKACWLTTRRSW